MGKKHHIAPIFGLDEHHRGDERRDPPDLPKG